MTDKSLQVLSTVGTESRDLISEILKSVQKQNMNLKHFFLIQEKAASWYTSLESFKSVTEFAAGST